MTQNERTNENIQLPEGPDFDLWSLVPEPEATVLEPPEEMEEEQVDEEAEEKASLPVVTGHSSLSSITLAPLPADWLTRLTNTDDLPSSVMKYRQDGKTLFESAWYPGILVDLQAFQAGEYQPDLEHPHWYAVLWIRHEWLNGPIPRKVETEV